MFECYQKFFQVRPVVLCLSQMQSLPRVPVTWKTKNRKIQVEKVPIPIRLIVLNSSETLGEIRIMTIPGMKNRMSPVKKVVFAMICEESPCFKLSPWFSFKS